MHFALHAMHHVEIKDETKIIKPLTKLTILIRQRTGARAALFSALHLWLGWSFASLKCVTQTQRHTHAHALQAPRCLFSHGNNVISPEDV